MAHDAPPSPRMAKAPRNASKFLICVKAALRLMRARRAESEEPVGRESKTMVRPIRPLVRHGLLSRGPELVVDNGEELLRRRGVPAVNALEKLGDRTLFHQ
jgi:hypothetical protein